MLSKCKNIEYTDTVVKIVSALNKDSEAQLDKLVQELCGVSDNNGGESKMTYVCDVCGWEYDVEAGSPENGIAPGTAFEDLPEDFVCPLCGVGKEEFSKAD